MLRGAVGLRQNEGYIQEVASIWSDATQRLGRRAIVQLPWPDLDAFETDRNVFKVSRAPYKRIFPRCAAIVHHGGAGTTQLSLMAGCPSVIVAHMSDQFFWGADLERLGVAGTTQRRNGLSGSGLAKALGKALESPATAVRAKALGLAMSHEDGVAVAVAAIERVLRTSTPFEV